MTVWSSLKSLPRIARALWGRAGILRLSPVEVVAVLSAWWRCRNSYAFLSTVAALRFGPRVALQDDDGSLTFTQLHQQSLALAHLLAHRFGVKPGSQVALVCGNGRGFLKGLLACTRLGADVLPLGPELPILVMERILERQSISLLLHDDVHAEKLSGCSPHLWRYSVDTSLPNTKVEPQAVPRGGELIVLTSGTTGISKGIRRRPTIAQLLPLLTGLLESLPISMHRPVVLAIPMHHGYGLATLAMSLVLGSPLQTAQRYDIAPLMTRLPTDERPFLVTVPTLLARWLPHCLLGAFPRPAAVITGSAPLDADLCLRLLDALGPVVFNLYGSSEAGLIALALPQALRQAPGSVGLPLPGNRLRLLDGAGTEVATGQLGRIFVEGPFVLPSGPDGWRETGDLGLIDEGGNLFVRGRADSMLISGGENVYPHEVEDVLKSHPEIHEVSVLVVDDVEFGQRMEAALVTHTGARLDEESLRGWLKDRLERHKIPRRFYCVAGIPRNALGKVDRVRLREMLNADGAE